MHESHPGGEDRAGRYLIRRDAGIPLWRQIAAALETRIRSGSYPPGGKLPAEGELAGWFGVNRHTVRRALTELKRRELVSVEQGRGTFVLEKKVDYAVSRRTRFSENLSRQNRLPDGRLVHAEVRSADPEISEALQLASGRSVARLDVLRQADGRDLSLSTHYFPLPRFAGIADVFRRTGSVTRCLAHFGVKDYFRDITRIVARPPTTEEARLLGQPRTRPVLETRSVNVDEHGVPVDFGVARYAGDRMQIVVKTN